MDNRTEIFRNPNALNFQLVWFSITYLILGAICILILLVPFDFLDKNFVLWALIIVSLAMLLYIVSVFSIRKVWLANKYFLAKDCLIITYGTSSTREDIFRYDTISTVSVSQKMSEKSRGYGRLILNVPDHALPIVLKDVNNPSEIANILQNHIVKATRVNTL